MCVGHPKQGVSMVYIQIKNMARSLPNLCKQLAREGVYYGLRYDEASWGC